MKTLKRLTTILIFCLAIASINAAAQTSAFTYQGKLTDISAPANGQYDFTFRLFDAATNGAQIGTNAACNGVQTTGADAVCDNVQVTGGIFTVNLNFGVNAFSNGAARFLEISVRAGASTGAYTTLAPRQEITSSPFSIKSLSAASADSLACSLCVTDGQIQSIDGSKVTGTVANAVNATSATTAGNVTGVVAITNGGTGSSTQNFVDLSTNQTVGGNKTFTGTVSGNGSGLTNVPGTLKWQTVSGFTQQAQPNTGYLATNDSQVTITLPTSIGIGEIVRVSGPGIGGWKIAQNDGQSVIGTNMGLIGANWSPRLASTSRIWVSVASSADGNKLVAVAPNGQIYTSTSSGANWILRESNRYWWSVASSADGNKLVAVVNGGQIYTSTNSGESWTARETNRNWISVASSADGSNLAAIEYGGKIYTSVNSGESWTPLENSRNWTSVATSADGSKIVAVVEGGQIYIGTNNPGSGWSPRESNRNWISVASSADGSKLVAVDRGGQIYTSTNSGASWTGRESNRNWQSVASSADGNKLVAVASSAQIYISEDAGISWKPRENNRSWLAVASSSDGSKLVAATQSGPGGGTIYTSVSSTTIGTTGYLSGGQHSAVELQYIGNGQFMPISYVGAISGF